MRIFKIAVLLLTVTLAPSAFGASTTGALLNSPVVSADVKQSLRGLVTKNEIALVSQWTTAAVAQLEHRPRATEAELLRLRAQSELSIEEVLAEFPSAHEKARRARPSSTPNGALYVDFYQESPVLLDYVGEGNVVKPMSFGVVYKYLKDESGKIVPHFVRAQLVSPGASGHRTSIGEFNIDRRHRYYVSQTYGSRMDYAQFFIGGIALHQTLVESYPQLGMPASHGCVRHHEYDADAMWNLVGDALDDNNLVNIKVYPFSVNVVLADGSRSTAREGFGEMLNDWLNRSIRCTRRDVASACTMGWDAWD